MASVMYTDSGVGKERLQHPRLYAADQWVSTGWDQALDIYGGLVKKILDSDGPSDIMFSAFDHGETVTFLSRGMRWMTSKRLPGRVESAFWKWTRSHSRGVMGRNSAWYSAVS